jgi:hypothetical protein
MLHKDYDRKGSAEKEISVRDPEVAWPRDELFGGKVTLTLSESWKGATLQKPRKDPKYPQKLGSKVRYVQIFLKAIVKMVQSHRSERPT